MSKFTDAWKLHQERKLTENGAVTFDTSANKLVDLFFTVGAIRGQGAARTESLVNPAFAQDPILATRLMLWARDARQGAGERQVFRDFLLWLEASGHEDAIEAILPKIPELGRWDDVLVFKKARNKLKAYDMIEQALRDKNGLCAKWLPRKGPIANELRKHFGLTPKQYRKVLVHLTKVVETPMCAKEWGSIDYEKVPSLAMSRYNKAFKKNDGERFESFGQAVVKGVDETGKAVKVNAGAVFPYDVLKPVVDGFHAYGGSESHDANVIRAQWNAMPNYVGKKNILPIIDVSESMRSGCGGNLSCMDVAVSLGLYLGMKNTGDFHNIVMPFSERPTLLTMQGDDVVSCYRQFKEAPWGYNTDLKAAFDAVLKFALKNHIPQFDMPEYILVLSDMEFDGFNPGKTAFEYFEQAFSQAGYRAPKLVWWNIQSRQANVPVRFDQTGTALVSGFSPAIAKNILSGEGIDPVQMMLRTIMSPRYDIDLSKVA